MDVRSLSSAEGSSQMPVRESPRWGGHTYHARKSHDGTEAFLVSPLNAAARDANDELREEMVSLLQSEPCVGRRKRASVTTSRTLDPGNVRSTLLRKADRLEEEAKHLRLQAKKYAGSQAALADASKTCKDSKFPRKHSRRKARDTRLTDDQSLHDGKARNGLVLSPGRPFIVRSPHTIRSPTANLDALYATFLDLYLARNSQGAPVTAIMSLLTVLPSAYQSQSRGGALEEAARALTIATIGGSESNPVLLQQSLKHYGRALSCLRRSISSPTSAQPEHTFAAILLLLKCSQFDIIKSVDDGWVRHLWGAQRYYIVQSSLPFQSQLGRHAFNLAKHISLCHALTTRKASPFENVSGPFQTSGALNSEWIASLLDILLPIPALLERHDQILAARSGQEREGAAEGLIVDCVSLERSLRRWYADWRRRKSCVGGTLLRERSIENFSTFCNLCQNRFLKSAYCFPDISYAFLVIWYWICLHHLLLKRCSLQTLGHTEDITARLDRETAHCESEALLLTLRLCKSIPYFCESESGIAANLAIMAPLRTVAAYCREFEFENLSQWVADVRSSVFVYGISPTNASSQSQTKT